MNRESFETFRKKDRLGKMEGLAQLMASYHDRLGGTRKISFIQGEKEECEVIGLHLFKREMTGAALADLGLAPEGGLVTVGCDRGGIVIDVMEPACLGFLAQTRIHFDADGELLLEIDDFRILRRNKRSRGIGTRLLAKLVRAAGEWGIDRIRAVTDPAFDENGCEILVRLGFRRSLCGKMERERSAIHEDVFPVSNFSAGFEDRQKGQNQENDRPFEFDPAVGSRSRRILDRRLSKSNGVRFQNSQFPGVRGNGITSRILAIPVTN